MARDLPEFLLGTSALQPGEESLSYERPSIRLLWAEVMQAVGVVGATILIQWLVYETLHVTTGLEDPAFAAESVGVGAIGLEIVFLGPRVFRAWIHVAFTEYVLTNERVYARTEFISTDLRVIPYERVTLLVLRRSLMEWALGIYQIQVRAYGDVREVLRLKGLRRPQPMFRAAREGVLRHNTAEAILRSD